jgi:serine/threonine protein kinase
LLADLAGALATIHGAGLVHGDVAPANVLLVDDDSRAILVDLGMASASASGGRGTPQYMAPEALAGHVEPRSDIYGLGAVAVRLVTGKPPFDAPTLGELAQRIVSASAPPALPNVPRPLADLIGRMLARDVEARPASALAVLDELDQIAPVIAPGLARRARPKVGAPPAPASWPGAASVTDAFARVLAGRPVIHVVAGVEETGGRQIVDGSLRKLALGEVAQGRHAPRVLAGTLDDIATRLGISPIATRSRARSGAAMRSSCSSSAMIRGHCSS